MNTKLKELHDASIQDCMGVKSIDPTKYAHLILYRVQEILSDAYVECPIEHRDIFYTIQTRLSGEFFGETRDERTKNLW